MLQSNHLQNKVDCFSCVLIEVMMDKKLQLDTLLTHAGIKTDEVIGVLTALLCLDGHNDILVGAV